MDMHKPEMERKVIGERIRLVRRCEKMSTMAFAEMLDVPVWTVELAENSGFHGDGAPVLLPQAELRALLEAIAAACDVPLSWLDGTSSEGGPSVPASGQDALQDELTFYLPMTVSACGVTDMLDMLCKLFGGRYDTECLLQERRFMRGMFELLGVYRRTLQQRGETDCANHIRQLVQDMVAERRESLAAN